MSAVLLNHYGQIRPESERKKCQFISTQTLNRLLFIIVKRLFNKSQALERACNIVEGFYCVKRIKDKKGTGFYLRFSSGSIDSRSGFLLYSQLSEILEHLFQYSREMT